MSDYGTFRFGLLAVIASAAACTVPALGGPTAALPEHGFEFYSGDDDDAGDLWLGFTTFTHEETGKTCILLPLYHVGEAAFYDEVQQEMDAADVVLTEGVRGAPSLAPGLVLTTYLFSSYSRFASFSGLTLQGEALSWRPNQRNADLRLAEFQERWPWTTAIGQAAFLPFLVVVWEPTVLWSWLERGGQTVVGRRGKFEAAWRHWLVHDANRDGEDHDRGNFLLPGVVEVRNERLLEVFDEVTADPSVRHIAVPWGAAHFPSLRPELEDRGWVETDHRWRRAIGVHALLEGGGDPSDEAFDLFVPWLGQVRAQSPSWSVSLLLHSIVVERRPAAETRVELLWELLFSLRSNPDSDELDLQVLPSLFGRPLLFEYAGARDGSRVRFLWFFEV